MILAWKYHDNTMIYIIDIYRLIIDIFVPTLRLLHVAARRAVQMWRKC